MEQVAVQNEPISDYYDSMTLFCTSTTERERALARLIALTRALAIELARYEQAVESGSGAGAVPTFRERGDSSPDVR